MHENVISKLQSIVDQEKQLCTSHHVVEGVLFVLGKHQYFNDLTRAVSKVSELLGLIMVEPTHSLNFSSRYTKLLEKFNLGVNDALLLQLVLDAEIDIVFSYDEKFLSVARELNIEPVDV